jgi:hypothetical protein
VASATGVPTSAGRLVFAVDSDAVDLPDRAERAYQLVAAVERAQPGEPHPTRRLSRWALL